MMHIFKTIVGFILRVLQYPLMLIPKNKRLIIFGAWNGQKYSDNSRAFFEYVNENSDYKCVWISKNRDVEQFVKQLGYKCEYAFSIKGIICQIRASVAISSVGITDFIPSLIPGCIHIELWHGVGGGKTIGLDDKLYKSYYSSHKARIYRLLDSIPHRKHYFISTSYEMKKVFASAFLIKEEEFISSGQPRNDIFYKKQYRFETIGEKEFSDKNLILYLPTHRKEGNVAFDCHKLLNLDEIDTICDKFNCIFLIKKHFYHRNEKENFDKYRNIIDITNADYDINELLLKSILVISDYSSVTADYLLLDRPILYYCFDLDEYLNEDREVYWDYDSITPGPKAHNFDELRKFLVEVLSGIDDYKLERKRVRDMFYDPSCQCEASGKILTAVENIINTNR